MTFRVGDSPARPDGSSKVRGTARYTDDLPVAGLYYGATVRSPFARARIDALRWRRERAPDGAVCVTAADLPGVNGVQLIDDRWPVLAADEVRHVGEAVALVAAPTRLDAQRALSAVEVEYTPLVPVLTLDEAADVEPLSELEIVFGDVDAALATAQCIVEGAYLTGHQEHIYIECQAMTAWFEEGGSLAVEGSMQCPYYVHKSLVHGFDLSAEQVRVWPATIGGGFGGKEDYPSMIAFHTALLARASGRPVRMAYDRHEDLVATGKRHPAKIRHRSGVDADGRLQAMEIDIVMDGGAYGTLSKVVLSRAALHATGPYRCPNVRVRARVLPTNTPPNGAFRGFGAPQVQFAAERQIDRIARVVGLDPLEIRLRNVVEAGDRLLTGQVLDETTAARDCLERVAERTDFRKRWQEFEAIRQRPEGHSEEQGGPDDGAAQTGLGLSLYLHGAGFTGNGERLMRSPVWLQLTTDGQIEILTAQTELGQGMETVFLQIAAEAAGVLAGDLLLAPADTARVPDSGPTAASRTTMVVGGVLARAAADLRHRLLAWWRQHERIDGELLLEEGVIRTAGAAADGAEWTFRDVARRHVEEVGPLKVVSRYEPAVGQSFDEVTYEGDAYPTFAWGADVAEVEVDPDTLGVKARKVTAVCEVGRAIHPVLCTGQVEGGTLQAVGWALMEEIRMEEGRYLNDRLATYIIPTCKDSPEIEVELLERPFGGGPFGAKGVGELPMDGGAPAIVAAIENATGIVVEQIPATPERLYADRLAGRTVAALAGSGAARSDGRDDES